MPEYKAPQREMKFVLNEVLNIEEHYQRLPGCEEATADVVDAILEEGAKFSERVLSPLNQIGDSQGCKFEDGVVTTPDGFKEAYQQFVEAGWPSLPHKPEFGGQGLPESLGIVINEMIGTANWSWSMYPGLSHGTILCSSRGYYYFTEYPISIVDGYKPRIWLGIKGYLFSI